MMMKLNSSLFDIPFVNNVLYYDTLDSTNNKAKELARRGSVDGSLVVAKSQTAGKGRLGRTFHSKNQDGLYFSIMLKPNVDPNHLSGITLATALALSCAMDEFCNVKTSIKWPNDILFNEKKVAGILTEAGTDYVIIGIGINVNTTCFSGEITKTATSLYLETGSSIDKYQLLLKILCKLNSFYYTFVNSLDLAFLVDEYNNRLGIMRKEVYIIPQQHSLNSSNPTNIDTTGLTPYMCLGIDKSGSLLCQDKDGTVHYVNSGEVSLRTV